MPSVEEQVRAYAVWVEAVSPPTQASSFGPARPAMAVAAGEPLVEPASRSPHRRWLVAAATLVLLGAAAMAARSADVTDRGPVTAADPSPASGPGAYGNDDIQVGRLTEEWYLFEDTMLLPPRPGDEATAAPPARVVEDGLTIFLAHPPKALLARITAANPKTAAGTRLFDDRLVWASVLEIPRPAGLTRDQQHRLDRTGSLPGSDASIAPRQWRISLHDAATGEDLGRWWLPTLQAERHPSADPSLPAGLLRPRPILTAVGDQVDLEFAGRLLPFPGETVLPLRSGAYVRGVHDAGGVLDVGGTAVIAGLWESPGGDPAIPAVVVLTASEGGAGREAATVLDLDGNVLRVLTGELVDLSLTPLQPDPARDAVRFRRCEEDWALAYAAVCPPGP